MGTKLENLAAPVQPVNNRLTDFEWTLLWMAIRYAMNRQTIASATLPQDIMQNWYKRLTNGQKQQLVQELKENEEMVAQMGHTAFGNPDIDRPHWLKFWKCLDESSHYRYKLTDGSTATVFEANGRFYPLNEYIAAPHREIYLPAESITEKA